MFSYIQYSHVLTQHNVIKTEQQAENGVEGIKICTGSIKLLLNPIGHYVYIN